MPIHHSEKPGMYCGNADGARENVAPSAVREASICSMALRIKRVSPALYTETKHWMRVSPAY